MVRTQVGNPVAGPDAESTQRVREAQYPAVQLTVGQRGFTVADGDGLRGLTGAASGP
jgi:hypothetical protein